MMLMRVFYPVVRFFLFLLSPEAAHAVTFMALKWADRLKLGFLYRQTPTERPIDVMGIRFPNGVGLAAGLDKDGAYLDGLAPLGFGFIEVGTVTPRPQPGNPKPRMFRIPKDKAIINRMGFNNQGIEAMIEHIRQSRYYQKGGIIGINIGKNADTPMEKAIDDYLFCLEKAYPYASYIAINISSPNTANLRDLQQADALDHLLSSIKKRQLILAEQWERYVPIAVKIAPDLTDAEIDAVADALIQHGMDGIIATNTTLSREGLTVKIDQSGGLSGVLLKKRADDLLSRLAHRLQGRLPIMGVGGIHFEQDVKDKLQRGASLVQIYTGFIFEGPALVVDCAQALADSIQSPAKS